MSILHKWRWDQGRLDYFLFDNIKDIASALIELDGAHFDSDPLRELLMERTGLLFKPFNYTVWRNYKRVFECALLATQINKRLYVSDICRKIAQEGYTVEADEFLSLHLPRFRYPFPAFAEQDSKLEVVYPFSAVLKFLVSRVWSQEEISLSPDEVTSFIVGNGATGFEDDEFYLHLKPSGYTASPDELRQVREMLIFMSQFSVLKWYQGKLVLDVGVEDASTLYSIRELANPVYVPLKTLRDEDFTAITALNTPTYKPLVIPSRESVTDTLFTEGKRTRVTHIKIERSPLLRKFFLQHHPEPICDMCQTNTRLRYPWTKNLIEVHHLLPLSSTLNVNTNGTSLDDVVGLCPNCHRSVHSFYKLWLDNSQIEDFKSNKEARAIYTKAKNSIVYMIKLKEKISPDEQSYLLDRCISQDLDLSTELKLLGFTYDNLRYQTYNHNQLHTNNFVPIEEQRLAEIQVPAVSFFAGAGGMDVGFDYAGFEQIASVEYIEQFCETLRTNFPDQLVIGPPHYSGDVKNREEIANALQSIAGVGPPFEGVFHGGPPCQPFSVASNQRFSKQDENFKRKGFEDADKGGLLLDYVWYIKRFLPRVFVIENVPGLLEMDNGSQLTTALNELSAVGYTITKPAILNAADFGVPQKRLRLFVVGVRYDEPFVFPQVDLFKTSCYSVFEVPLDGVDSHITRNHSAESISRYIKLAYGERDQLGRVDRLNPYLPSKTVIAGGTKGGGRSHLHPYSPRTLSVRESARLQTFPDHYLFTGPHSRQFTQVGNAVPPLLAFRLAKTIRNQYFV